MHVEFFGAAGEVTGSCHVLRVGRRTVLIDCGMIQGSRADHQRNRSAFPFEPALIDAVILTHAHIDHCGRLPLLVKRGFKGPVFTTKACCELAAILLADSAHLAERDADRANRHRIDDSLPMIEPLYTVEDARTALERFEARSYGTWHEAVPGLRFRFHDAGHIMGSACVLCEISDGGVTRNIAFSGDIGPRNSPILLDPECIPAADMVVMESTYGDRLHRGREATERELGQIIRAANEARGNIVIPAFAVGRSQELLYLFAQNFHNWGLADWRIYLDSPMAISATEIYWNNSDRFDAEALRLKRAYGGMPPLPNLVMCRDIEASKAINEYRAGSIIIAGSGMCNGGRVLHHLMHNLHRHECHVIIVGFQAAGTLGRELVERRASVNIYGRPMPVAAEIHTVGGLSAHGDRDDLLHWYGGFAQHPPLYLVHGEGAAASALAQTVQQRFGRSAVIAAPGLQVDLAKLAPITQS
jgi:metallo-beta-lactamase family protein